MSILLVVSALSGAIGFPGTDPCPEGWQDGFGVPGVGGFEVLCSVVHDDGSGPALFVGGSFTSINGVVVNNIAKWDGNTWQSLAGGMTSPTFFYAVVESLAVYNGELIASGWFQFAGGQSLGHVVRWDGTQWHQLGVGVRSRSGAPHGLLTVWNGELLVGGGVQFMGNTNVLGQLIAWNGTDWRILFQSCSHLDTKQIASFQGELLCLIGGVLRRWDGNNWVFFLGALEPYSVERVSVIDGELWAGVVHWIEPDAHTYQVLAWDDPDWRQVGGDLTFAPRCFVQSGSRILAGGGNTNLASNSNDTGFFAALENGNWENLGSPIVWGNGIGAVNTLAPYNGRIFVGGDFTATGGLPSVDIAFWGSVGPMFSVQPGQESACPGQVIALTGEAAGSGTIGYQWVKDGAPVGDGGNVSGATTSTLTLMSVDLTDSGAYELMATDECGATSSQTALVIVACCSDRPDGDLNADGFSNGADIQMFVDAVVNQQRSASVVCPADFDYDRLLGPADVAGFVEALLD